MLSGGKSRELADTLEIYLENERSLNKTAAEQKLHKNTISYRVQRSLEQTGIDPDDPHQRLYALFSFSVIRTIEETAEGSLNHT
jgi:DNA-binding PucR family transcriptional regulator